MQNLSAVDFLSQLQNQTTPYSLVLDIDDTLIDCRHRKKMILRSFVEQVWNAGNYQHDDLQRLLDIKQDQVRFRISECLAAISIEHASLEKELFDYWLRHYFTYPYLKQDIAFDGAIAFTKACLDAGAHMIYLTGRDEGGMGQGTRERLAELGFPLNDERCKLILKSDPEQADLDFKQSAIRTIAEKEPPVLALFEIEIRNLNMMVNHFPESMFLWRPTLQSPGQPSPHPQILRFASFV